MLMPVWKVAIWAAGAVLLSSSLLYAQPGCSAGMLVGTYAVRGQGTIFEPVPGSNQTLPIPDVHVGIASIDYNGNITGRLFGTDAGVAAEATVTATADVASDCTGADHYTVSFIGGPTVQGTNQLLILDGGNQVIAMAGSMNGFQAAVGETWQRISMLPIDYFSAETPCTSDMLRGTYGFSYTGSLIMTLPGSSQPVPLPFYMVGTSWTDNTGRSPGRFIENVAGSIAPGTWTTAPGATQVNADCTGSMEWSLTGPGAPPGTGLDRFVILNGGQEFWSVTVRGIMGAPSFMGTFKRISN